jgi:hypothetical protein
VYLSKHEHECSHVGMLDSDDLAVFWDSPAATGLGFAVFSTTDTKP